MLTIFVDLDINTPEGLGTVESPANLQQLYDNDDWYYSYSDGTIYKMRGVYRYTGEQQLQINLESWMHYTANSNAQKIFEAWDLSTYGQWGFVGNELFVNVNIGTKKDAQLVVMRDYFICTNTYKFTAEGSSSEGAKYEHRNAYINTNFFHSIASEGTEEIDWLGCSIIPKVNEDGEAYIDFDPLHVNALQRFYYSYFGEYYHNKYTGTPTQNAWHNIHPNYLKFYNCYFENGLNDEVGVYINDSLFTLGGAEVIDKDNIGHVSSIPIPSAKNLSIAFRTRYQYLLFDLPKITNPVILSDFITKNINKGLFGDNRIAIGAFEFSEELEDVGQGGLLFMAELEDDIPVPVPRPVLISKTKLQVTFKAQSKYGELVFIGKLTIPPLGTEQEEGLKVYYSREKTDSCDLRLGSNHDLLIVNNDFDFVYNIDKVRQNLKIRLQSFINDWYLDITDGIDYYGIIFVKDPDMNLIDSVIKTIILETDGIIEILEYNSQIQRD